jgi:hypothetical protein
MKNSKRNPVNLLDLKPSRNVRWETAGNEGVILVIPKIRHPFAAHWILPLLSKPDLRLTLDEVGSFIWRQCDGSKTVMEIADQVTGKFGRDFDPEFGRIASFLRTLTREEYITMSN